MNSIKKIIAVLMSAVLFTLGCLQMASADDASDEAVEKGFANVDEFGAVSNDKKDDYAAFEAALATGKNLYIPSGKYYLSKPLIIENRICRGSNPGRTQLIGMSDDKFVPIMIVSGCSSIYDIAFLYTVDYTEKVGERVALQLGSEGKPLTEGSVIRSLYFSNVGTAIYSPANSGCSGTLIDTIEIAEYSYRGVDMQSKSRIMNTYSNLYINAGAGEVNHVNCGFALEGSEYSATVNQLNIEHDIIDYGIIFRNVKNLNVSTIHVEGVNLAQEDIGYVFCENTSGYIGAYTTYFTYVNKVDNSLICFGNSESSDKLTIGILHPRGINMPDRGAHPDWREELANMGLNAGLNGRIASTFRTFSRKNGATGDYSVNVKSFAAYSYDSAADYDFYRPVTKKGNINFSVENY